MIGHIRGVESCNLILESDDAVIAKNDVVARITENGVLPSCWIRGHHGENPLHDDGSEAKALGSGDVKAGITVDLVVPGSAVDFVIARAAGQLVGHLAA